MRWDTGHNTLIKKRNMDIYTLKNCDTCRKALREIRDSGGQPTVIDVMAGAITSDDIQRFLAAFGEALVNRRSTTWRGLSQAERQQDPVALLIEFPKLMKRPVIDAGGQLFLGWGPEVRAKVLGTQLR